MRSLLAFFITICASSLGATAADEPLSSDPLTLLKEARAMADNAPREAIRHLAHALELPMDSVVLQQVLNLKGQLHYQLAEFADARSSLNIVASRKSTPVNEIEIAIAQNLLCGIYTYEGDFRKGLDAGYKARLTFEEKGQTEYFASLYNNLGLLYFRMQNFEKAIYFYRKSIAADQRSERNSMALRYFNLSLCYTALDSISNAFSTVRAGQNYCKGNCSRDEQVMAEHALGMANFREGSIDLAYANFRRALVISDTTAGDLIRSDNLRMLGSIHFQKKQFDSALNYLQKAEQVATGTRCDKCLLNTYESLIAIFKAQGKAKRQSEVQQKYIDLKEGMFNSELMRDLAIVEGKHLEKEHLDQIAFQGQQLKAQEEMLKYQLIKAVLIGVVCLLLVVLVVIQIRNVRIKRSIHLRLEAKVKERIEILAEKKRQILEEQEIQKAALQKFASESKERLGDINKTIIEQGDQIDGLKHPVLSLYKYLEMIEPKR
jgi:tetratricopeptide (TPR) repeat protein